MVNAAPQAVIKIIRNGGTRSPGQIRNQWRYISKGNSVQLELPDDAQGVILVPEQWTPASKDWAVSTGKYTLGQADPANNDMTTHIVVSFPPGTDPRSAKSASRAWAEKMFRGPLIDANEMDDDPTPTSPPYDVPQRYNYVAAFHTDRDHPHMHIVVNRRGDEGGWQKISKRHPVMNYDTMREKLVEAAAGEGIQLEATTRAERGIDGPNMTDAEYRRQERERRIEINPPNISDRPLNSDSESDGGTDYDDDSDVHYSIAASSAASMEGRASAAPAGIPDEISFPDAETDQDHEGDIVPESVARATAPDQDEYDGDSESDTVRRRQRVPAGESGTESDDGGGKPPALTGDALEALRQNRSQTGENSDPVDTEAPSRKRGRTVAPERTMTLRSDDAAQAAQTGSAETEDAPEPAGRRRRVEIPERTMELRSDAERQRLIEEEAAMHLRSGRIVPKREREEDRTDERNIRPRNR